MSNRPMIAIVDYEMGNLRSVQKGFEVVGHRAVVTRDPEAIDRATHVVLPGVGAFGDCMDNLNRYGLIDPLLRAIRDDKPFMGICLGYQLLFEESEEFGVHKGLGVLPGKVKALPITDSHRQRLKIPHMGWNTVNIRRTAPPLEGIPSGSYVYFVHSFYVVPAETSLVSTETDYGVPFASSIWQHNIFATQFHPEKSQGIGLRILKNFGNWR